MTLMAYWQIRRNSKVRWCSVFELWLMHWVVYLILVTWLLRLTELERSYSMTSLDGVLAIIFIGVINVIAIWYRLLIICVINRVGMIWYLSLASKIFYQSLIHDYACHLNWTSRCIDIDSEKLSLLSTLRLKYLPWWVCHLFVELTTRYWSDWLRTPSMLSSESLLLFHFLQSMLLLEVLFNSLKITSFCLCPSIFHYRLLFDVISPFLFILD